MEPAAEADLAALTFLVTRLLRNECLRKADPLAAAAALVEELQQIGDVALPATARNPAAMTEALAASNRLSAIAEEVMEQVKAALAG